MATFLSKLRVVTLGTAHDLLNQVIDSNSPSAMRQYVRDLESAIDKLKTEAATQDGQIRILNREKSELDSKIATDKQTISKLMVSTQPNAKEIAKGKAAVVIQNQKQSDQYVQDIQVQTEAAAKLNATIVTLDNKHTLMVSRVRELERLDRDSKAKESAASALKNAGSLIDSGNDISIDDVENKMRSRNDVASAKFDQALGGIQTDTTDSDDVNALLESLTPTTQGK